ncbi:MAG: gliding motility-associated C-terminal domain-containing protein, partial [Bacteroidales bacterium]|nr:gliding motility-associated C-terminal domain-containing protein [Bacteroidales bacterium]
RWGKKVYEINNYKNDWDGGNLSDGVYFYILKCHGEFGDDIFKSSLTIIGSGK